MNVHIDFEEVRLATINDGGFTLPLGLNSGGRYVIGDGRDGLILTSRQLHSLHGADALKAAIKSIMRGRVGDLVGVGTWINDGKVYVDPITFSDDLGSALSIAAERGELAIFDTELKQEIKCNHAPCAA